jgi:hypothetical protein
MRRMKLALVAALLAVSPFASAQIITNGSFEFFTLTPPVAPAPWGFTFPAQGSLLGWSIPGGNVDLVQNTYWQASNGSWSLDLDGSTLGVISQTFTAPGAGTNLFNLGFDLSGNPQGPPGVKLVKIDLVGAHFLGGLADTSRIAAFDTSAIGTIPVAAPIANMQWQPWSFSFMANALGGSVTLSFTSLSNLISPGPYAFGPALDNVSVTQVPEPGTYAMMIAGLALLGFMARRRLRG